MEANRGTWGNARCMGLSKGCPCHPDTSSDRVHIPLFPPPMSCSMCLFIQNQNFERYTENMLNQLAEGSKFAKSQLDAMSGDVGRLAGSTAELAGKAEATLGLLHEHRQLEEVRCWASAGEAVLDRRAAGEAAGQAAKQGSIPDSTAACTRPPAAPQESLALAKKARAEAAAYFQTLDAKQQLALELQVGLAGEVPSAAC